MNGVLLSLTMVFCVACLYHYLMLKAPWCLRNSWCTVDFAILRACMVLHGTNKTKLA